jgi:hypothetical protein
MVEEEKPHSAEESGGSENVPPGLHGIEQERGEVADGMDGQRDKDEEEDRDEAVRQVENECEEENWNADDDKDEQEDEDEEEEEYDGKDFDWSQSRRKRPRRESEDKVPNRRSSFMKSSSRDLIPREPGKERVRGFMRYSGPLSNPLLKSRSFHWPEYRDQKLLDMAKEGWITDPAKHPWIGTTIRRFFVGVGKADGVIVGQLPAALNDGHCIWHIVHDDGDSEDLSDDDTKLCRQMLLRNDTQPRIPPNRIEYLFCGKKLDMTFPLYRKNCQIGPDYQVQEIPDCTKLSPTDSPVSSQDASDLSSDSPLPALEVGAGESQEPDSVVTASPEYQEFQRQAIALLLIPGIVTRYLGPVPTCQSQSDFSLDYLDLVCCVSATSTADRYVVFDGEHYHTCHAQDLAQPFSDSVHLPSLFLENHCDVQNSLSALRAVLQLHLSTDFTPQQLLILQTFFSSWVKYGSDVYTSFHRSSLHSLISYRDMVSLFYKFLPYLSRNDEYGAAERASSLYALSFALRGISCECPQENNSSLSDSEAKKKEPSQRAEEGDWGSEDDICDVFFPKGTSSKSSSRSGDSSQSRRRIQQIDLISGALIQTFSSGAMAARATGVEARCIVQCCQGKRSAAGGFSWKFSDLSSPRDHRSTNGLCFTLPPPLTCCRHRRDGETKEATERVRVTQLSDSRGAGGG